MTAEPLAPLHEVIRELQLSAKKSLGQHFLTDHNLLTQVVACAGDITGVHVLEIGPGPGGLTRALLESKAAHVTALEKDQRFAAALLPLHAHFPQRFTLIEADALAVKLTEQLPAPRAVIANLPYNIGTELVVRMLHDIAADPTSWHSITVMLQYEVAARFCAAPRTDAYGRLSVLSDWLCEGVIQREIPPGAFSPPPKVNSAMLHLKPRPAPKFPATLASLERVVAAAFNQRRKMLRASLKSLGVDGQSLCDTVGIDATRRAETLSTEEFCALANAYKALKR